MMKGDKGDHIPTEEELKKLVDEVFKIDKRPMGADEYLKEHKKIFPIPPLKVKYKDFWTCKYHEYDCIVLDDYTDEELFLCKKGLCTDDCKHCNEWEGENEKI